MAQGEEERGEAVSNEEGANGDQLIYPSGYSEMFKIKPQADSRISLPVGENRANGASTTSENSQIQLESPQRRGSGARAHR